MILYWQNKWQRITDNAEPTKLALEDGRRCDTMATEKEALQKVIDLIERDEFHGITKDERERLANIHKWLNSAEAFWRVVGWTLGGLNKFAKWFVIIGGVWAAVQFGVGEQIVKFGQWIGKAQ
jgi:hypothetical protein